MEETKNTNLKRYLHPKVHSSIVYNSQDMETTSASITNKEDVVYITMEQYSVIKEERNVAICNNMNGKRAGRRWNKEGYYAK